MIGGAAGSIAGSADGKGRASVRSEGTENEESWNTPSHFDGEYVLNGSIRARLDTK
jgi:hypothetical protein